MLCLLLMIKNIVLCMSVFLPIYFGVSQDLQKVFINYLAKIKKIIQIFQYMIGIFMILI